MTNKNEILSGYIKAANEEFQMLKNRFSNWFGPRYFVANESVHSPDGFHFRWPETIEKVSQV